jgi:hypothetical protein
VTTPSSTTPRFGRLDVAFWLFVAAAAMCVLVVVVGLTSIGATVGVAQQKGTDPAAARTYVAIGIAVVLLFELAEAVLFVVFARLARRGVRWARIGLVVLTVLALLGFSEGSFVLGVLRFVLAAAGTILLFLPPARGVTASDAGRTFSR